MFLIAQLLVTMIGPVLMIEPVVLASVAALTANASGTTVVDADVQLCVKVYLAACVVQ